MEKETRALTNDQGAEIRKLADSRTVEGYGIVFNKESKDLGGFIEVILPQAMQGVIASSDIYATLNHNTERGILARSKRGKGSLTLEVDDVGVKYKFDAPSYPLGDEVLQGVERGDISTSSFSFTVDAGGENWEKMEDGRYKRTISKFMNIFDIGPVYNEAYVDTSIARRSMPTDDGAAGKPAGNKPAEPIQRSATTRVALQRYKFLKRKR